MVSFEKKKKKDKRFFCQTKQSNIHLPKEFYTFLGKNEPHTYPYVNGQPRFIFDDANYDIFLVRKAIDEYFDFNKTNIDFPIFYYNDVKDIGNPEYDLGWSFDNNRKLTNRTVILSHNMRNVSNKPLITDKNHARFEQLMSYIYYDFVKDNKYT